MPSPRFAMVPSDPFPFFVGCGRSGTTLLRAMFTTHPDLAVTHESRFVSWVLRHPERYGSGPSFEVDAFLTDVLGEGDAPSRVATWPIDRDMLRAAVRAAQPVALAEAVRAVYRAYATAHDKPRYADKTPRYVNDVGRIAAALPEARFVHLIRDGRDVALAWRDVPFGARGAYEAATLWSRKVERARRDGEALGADRYLEVRYEALVADPEPSARRISSFLDLPFDPIVLEHHTRPEASLAELGDQPHHERLQMPITPGLRDWRAQMSHGDVRRFEAVAGPLLERLGYEVRHPGADGVGSHLVAPIAFALGRARSKAARRTGDPT